MHGDSRGEPGSGSARKSASPAELLQKIGHVVRAGSAIRRVGALTWNEGDAPANVSTRIPLYLYFAQEAFMADEIPTLNVGARRNEDIALDMMKFIALTSGYGKTGSPGAGFQGATVSKAEEYAHLLLELYSRCLHAVSGKK